MRDAARAGRRTAPTAARSPRTARARRALAAAGPRARGRARGVRAAGRGDLRGLPAALRRARAWCARPRPTCGLLAGDRLYAIGLARLVELGDTRGGRRARRHDHAERARARRRRARSWPRRCGRPGARAVGWGPSERAPARQGAAAPGRPGGARGDAHKCAGRAPAPR